MESKGEKVNYFWTSPIQFFSFYELIKKERDTENKRKYLFLLLGQILLIPIYIFGMAFLFTIDNT